jgi:hypothetical protein
MCFNKRGSIIIRCKQYFLVVLFFVALLPIKALPQTNNNFNYLHFPRSINKFNKLNPDKANLFFLPNQFKRAKTAKQRGSSNSLLDSIIFTTQNSNILNSKNVFHYNDGRLSDIYEYCSDQMGGWDKTGLEQIVYDSKGQMISILSKVWLGEWANMSLCSFGYDSCGNNTNFSIEKYSNGQWRNFYRKTCKYNSDNKVYLGIRELWTDSNWVNDTKFIQFYNSKGETDSLVWELWSNDKWVNESLILFQHDVHGRDSIITSRYWMDSVWVNSLTDFYIYDSNGNNISHLIESWDGSQWINDNKFIYTYNSDNACIYGVHENWQNEEWSYGNGDFENSIGDNFGFVSIAAEENLYYSEPTDVKDKKTEINKFRLSQNYPNPFNPSTKISFNLTSDSKVTLKVFNVLGQQVASLANGSLAKGAHVYDFNASKLNSGVYIYSLTALRSDGAVYKLSKKMVLMK